MSTPSEKKKGGLRVAFALMLLSSPLAADGLSGSVTPQLGGGIGGFDAGISNLRGTSGGTTPCNAGQLDFSDGCNTTLYMVGL